MKIFEPYKKFEDGKGTFTGIVNSGLWEEINYVETAAGKVRGGHYHRETRELFFIIEGDIDITVTDLDGNVTHAFSASRGSIFIIEPLEVHTFVCRTDCRWINIMSRRIDDQFHDIHPLTHGPRA